MSLDFLFLWGSALTAQQPAAGPLLAAEDWRAISERVFGALDHHPRGREPPGLGVAGRALSRLGILCLYGGCGALRGAGRWQKGCRRDGDGGSSTPQQPHQPWVLAGLSPHRGDILGHEHRSPALCC